MNVSPIAEGMLQKLERHQKKIAYLETLETPASYPVRATMWHDESIVVAGNTLTHTTITSQRYNSYSYQNTPALSDSFDNACFMAAGTYTFYVLGIQSPAAGICKWQYKVPGGTFTDFITGQDWYNASLAYNTVLSGAITLPLGGYIVIRCVCTGKNASSSNYNLYLTKFWIKPSSY